jgi:SP family general alpha glucoside:H+ symporter-like MFS transporter
MWSMLLSLSIVMVGYDNSLISNFFGYPSFQKKYGNYYPKIGYQLSAQWQIALPDSATVGIILGSQLNGFAASRYGYKVVMIVSLIAMTGLIFIPFFATSVKTLCAAEILCGLFWGVFTTVGAAYASEVCPVKLRGFLTSWVNCSQIIGQLIAIGVLQGLIGRTDQWSYRIPFAIQWVWPLPLAVIVFFAPESPWWLARKEKLQEAETSIKRLGNKTDEQVKEQLAMIIHTIRYENEVMAHGTASYLNCFKGSNLRRTEIACMVFVGQVTCGIFMLNSGSYFFEQAGIAAAQSYKITTGQTALGLISTVIGSFIMAKYGRRRPYIYGFVLITFICALVGILAVVPQNSSLKWVQVAFSLVWVCVYNLTLGPTAYAISSEVSAMHLRVQTVCLAKAAHQLSDLVAGVLEPYMINPTRWNWKGATAFFWGGTSLATTVWAYYRVPETRGRTYEELDVLFERKISARAFEHYEIDVYGSEKV